MRALLCLGLLGLSCAPLAGQEITFAEGAAATALQVATVPESSPNSPGSVLLSGVELLPVEITGRTLLQEQDPTASRRISRNGILRIELPGGGRVYRYRRLGGQAWGFLGVAAGGGARVLLELPGTGAGGTQDPFLDRIGVAADGLHAAFAQARGIWLVRLDGGIHASTGQPHRLVTTAADVAPASVMAGSTHAFWQTLDGRLWRCALADGAQPADVSPPPVANAIWKDEMAMSGDGGTLVFLYGPRDQQRLWVIGAAGAAAPLPPPPGKYEEPGYLPAGPGEPALLLNRDGTRLFYVDASLRDELHLLDVQGQLPDLQITGDPIFQPYIGVHILPSFAGTSLTVAIGDVARMDWFRVALATTGGTVVNVTATGSALQPFPAGALDPVQASPAGGALLVTEQGASAFVLRRLDPAPGGSAVLHQDLLGPPQPGRSGSRAPDLVVHGTGGDRLYLGGSGAMLAATPPGLLLSPPDHGPQFAGSWLHLPSEWGLVVFYLPDGTALAGPVEFGVTQVAMTAAGGAVVVGSPVRYLAPGVFTVLARPPAAFRAVL